ncbi:MAG TPA: hypothetical protein VIH57_05440 [Bacteroidales bacterium]
MEPKTDYIINKKPLLQPKAASSLYLNQATHNAGIVLGNVSSIIQGDKELFADYLKRIESNLTENQIQKLESRSFAFLRADKIVLQKKKEILFKLLYKLDELRNFHSHYYHFSTLFYFNDEELKLYLEEKFTQACDGLLSSYTPEELAHLNIEDENYRFFKESTDGEFKYCFNRNQKAMAFLASFFLDKRQTNLLLSKIKGFKKAIDKPSQATRDAFTYFCMKNESSFVSEDTNVRFFVDAISHLSKMPQEVFENLDENSLTLKITAGALGRMKDRIFQTMPKQPKEKKKVQEQKDAFNKLREIEEKEFNNTKEFLEEVEKRIGHQNIKKYRTEILEEAQENFNIRTSRDRFTHFALQYIDDFDLLPGFRFKAYTGRETRSKETKVYHSKKSFEKEIIKRETIYSKINDLRPNDKEEGYSYQYVIRDNNVFFEYSGGNRKYKGSLSIHELRNLTFALMDVNLKESVREKMISFLENYTKLYNNIANGMNKKEIKRNLTVEEKYLPEYLVKWLNNSNFTYNDLVKAVLNKLKYTVTYAQKFLDKESPSYYKKLRKFDKIKEILLFVNHNVAKYIDQEQYEKLEILLGSFPKYRDQLLDYLKEQQINASCTTAKEIFSFHAIVKESADLENILYKTLNATIKWSQEKIRNIEKTPDPEFVKTIAHIINVSSKEYTDARINENIQKFLADNIILPRGFVLHFFYDKEKNISKRIMEFLPNLRISDFYQKVFDYKYDIEAYDTYGKKVDELKTKDKLLLLMTKNYLEKKIAPASQTTSFQIEGNVADILDKEISILFKHIEGKKITFGIKDYDEILVVLNDKRLEKILRYYLPGKKNIYFIDREKYKNPKDESGGSKQIYDLQDALHTIEREQLEVVDTVLKLEKEALTDHISGQVSVVTKEEIENYLDKGWQRNLSPEQLTAIKSVIEPLLIETDKNRIETRKLLELKGLTKEKIESIIKYRRAAFHNGLPEDGKFNVKSLLS